MRSICRSSYFLACGLLLGLSVSAYSQTPMGLTLDKQQTLPVKLLRGYGSLAAHWTQYHDAAGKHASLTVLYAPTPDKAALSLGKYNSDLHELGEVAADTLTIGTRSVPLSEAPGQGVIAAFRQGATVYIAAAEDRSDLPGLLAATPLSAPGAIDFTGGAVPMYLNFFDKYGWGFYYDNFIAPDNQDETYDHRLDYDFAQKNGVTLHFETGANYSDTAEGVIAWTKVEAGLDLARQRNIPAYVGAFGKSAGLWVLNRYPFDMAQYMPDYVGRLYGPGYDAGAYGPSFPAWSSVDAENVQLDMFAPFIRKYSQYPNVVEFMEPHKEMEHGTPAVMVDYGPVADAAYRRFLRGKYSTIAAVNQRWHDVGRMLKSWDDVRVPEVASFLGWGPGAFDLKGVWRITQDSKLTAAQAAQWYAPDLDDSKWDQLLAPGDDRGTLRPADRTYGTFRRTFDLPDASLAHLKTAGNGKIYLYVWDMEGYSQTPLEAAFNGVKVGDFTNPSTDASWSAFEVSAALKSGSNQLSLHLPWGELCYKIYLSSNAPRCYPDLTPGEDARWVDFRDFTTWTRGDSRKRGMEMIRREDKERTIRNDSPYAVMDVDKALMEDYGGQGHDTGGMSGNWSEYLPALMRGSGLPATAEPGNPGHDLNELKTQFGLWSTEGLNAVDYFQNMGDVLWKPDQKAWFEANQPLVHLIGKYHSPRAQVAVMQGIEAQHLTGFPWNKFTSDLTWGLRRGPVGAEGAVFCPHDFILENDFARGNADRYKVIIDDNTMVMDDALLVRIEKWVRAGGIFMTYGHSGQHSPLAANTWAISRLTGYKIIGNDDNLGYRVVPGQTILTNPILSKPDADGKLHRLGGAGVLLQKMAPECRDLLAWENNKGVALGLRPLGKGYIIASGTVYSSGPTGTGAIVVSDLLRWCGVTVGIPSATGCHVGSFVSNSGLYDVHVLWNESIPSGAVTSLQVPHADSETMTDISIGKTLTGTKAFDGSVTYAGLPFGSRDTRAFLSPRHAIASAPLEWLLLQRDWWKGTKTPPPAPPLPTYPNTLDLTLDNAFSPVPDDATDLTPYVGAKVDDSAWKRLDFGIWSAAFPDVTRGVFRKKFLVPAGWRSGQSWIWINSTDAASLRPPYKNKVFLDGAQIEETKGMYDTLIGDFTKHLAPGPHVLAVVSEGGKFLNGLTANVWVEHLPKPVLRQALDGSWGIDSDGKPITLPGTAPLTGARRTFIPNSAGKGKTVMLFGEGHPFLVASILLNGHWISRSYGMTRGEHFRFNLTPYIKWGQPNDIELRPTYGWPMTTSVLEVRYYDPGTL